MSAIFMEPLIYYPNFEPPNDTWLKFSLLYLENFKSIVPQNRRNLLSDNYRRIEGETDLVELYSPAYNDGYNATLNSIEEANKFFNSPYERSGFFNEANIIRKWQNPKNWTYEVCQEKFSQEWLFFCQDHKIGIRSENGIMLPEELAFLFMANLAKEIAFTSSAAIITDNNRFDNYTNYSRGRNPMIDRRIKFAKGIISLMVPQNLSDISFNRLIDFRNTNRDRIRAFNSELLNVQEKISNGFSGQDFIQSYNNIYSEFSKEVALLGIGIAAIPFAAYMLITNPVASTPEYIYETLGAIGGLFGGGFAINKSLYDSKNKRYCKKYLTNLQRLK